MPGDGRQIEAVVLNREDVLRAIVRQSRTKRELTEAVNSSRSTVDRAIRELLDAGLVRQTGGEYEATMAAECALDAVETFHGRMRTVSDAVAVLGHLPADTPFDPVFLEEAEVQVATPAMPDGVVQRLFESIESASYVRGIAPVVLSGHLQSFYEAAKAGDARIEMLIDGDVLDRMVASPNTRDILAAQLRDEQVSISRVDVPFSFGVWITEDEAGVVVYSDTGVRGIIVNDTDEAYAWAERWFDDLSAEATALTVDGVANPGDE
jgi:predicted transcriptional regulator